MMRILLLSDSTGGGHTKAAEAVAESIRGRNPQSQTLIADSLKIVSPLIDKLVVGTYLKTVRNAPFIYGKLYRLSEKGEGVTNMAKALNTLLSNRLYDFISAYSPSVIICTHTIPLQMLSSLKRKGRISVPVIGLVTDFVNHYFWKLEGVDAFVVAHENIKTDMVKMGIPKERVYTYGIPVSSSFLNIRKDRNRLLEEYGLKDKLTLLLMGGSLGFGGVKEIFASLLKSSLDMQVIALAGYNAKLKKQLQKLAEGTDKCVRILDYTENVSDLMDISDFLITKPGGMTVSEAMVKKLPILINSPIPGQEERNARFLVGTGAAVRIADSSCLDTAFNNIIENPSRVQYMKRMAEQLAKPGAGEDIAFLVENIADKYKSSVSGDLQRKLPVNPVGIAGDIAGSLTTGPVIY